MREAPLSRHGQVLEYQGQTTHIRAQFGHFLDAQLAPRYPHRQNENDQGSPLIWLGRSDGKSLACVVTVIN